MVDLLRKLSVITILIKKKEKVDNVWDCKYEPVAECPGKWALTSDGVKHIFKRNASKLQKVTMYFFLSFSVIFTLISGEFYIIVTGRYIRVRYRPFHKM